MSIVRNGWLLLGVIAFALAGIVIVAGMGGGGIGSGYPEAAPTVIGGSKFEGRCYTAGEATRLRTMAERVQRWESALRRSYEDPDTTARDRTQRDIRTRLLDAQQDFREYRLLAGRSC